MWTYWSYGEVRTRTGTSITPFTFCGAWGYFKDSAARIYVRARVLRTELAQWMTVDPLWPTEPSYTYCNNNPLSHTDPTGLQGGGAGVLAGGAAVALSEVLGELVVVLIIALLGIVILIYLLYLLVLGLTILIRYLCAKAKAAKVAACDIMPPKCVNTDSCAH